MASVSSSKINIFDKDKNSVDREIKKSNISLGVIQKMDLSTLCSKKFLNNQRQLKQQFKTE